MTGLFLGADKVGMGPKVHDEWFHRQVELAVREANHPEAEWDSETEVKRQSAMKREIWLGKLAAQKRAAITSQ